MNTDRSAVSTAQDIGSRSQGDHSDTLLHPVLRQNHIHGSTVEQSLHCKDTIRIPQLLLCLDMSALKHAPRLFDE